MDTPFTTQKRKGSGKMTFFQDANGREWNLRITVKAVQDVREHVQNPETGEYFDLYEIVETGNFKPLKKLDILVKTAFWLLYDEIIQEFDFQEFENAREKTGFYESFPEKKNQTRTQKMFDWFQTGLTGEVLEEMADALSEAIVNFTVSRTQKEALKEILASEKELETEAMKLGLEKFRERTARIREKMPEILEENFQREPYEN